MLKEKFKYPKWMQSSSEKEYDKIFNNTNTIKEFKQWLQDELQTKINNYSFYMKKTVKNMSKFDDKMS